MVSWCFYGYTSFECMKPSVMIDTFGHRYMFKVTDRPLVLPHREHLLRTRYVCARGGPCWLCAANFPLSTLYLNLRHHTIAPHSRRVPSRLYDFEIKRSFKSSISALVQRGRSRTEVLSRCRGVKLSISPYEIDAPRPQVD